MKFIAITFLTLMIFISTQNDNNSVYKDLAKSIIEKKDSKQIKSLTQKFATYQKDSSTVFSDGWYYYDTINWKFQKSRGTTDSLKKNIFWFLLIDNLQIGNYTWEIDWKQPENEILGIIGALAKKKKYVLPEIPTAQGKTGLDAGGRMAFYNKALQKAGFTLINLYIDSDSYVTALIKKDNFQKVSKLAEMTGNKITEY